MSTPTDRLKAAAQALYTLQASLSEDLIPLSPKARKQALRPPAGFARYLRHLADELARLPGVTILLEVDPNSIEPRLARIEALESALFAAEALVRELEDTRTHLRAELWELGLSAHATFRAVGKRDPRYEAALGAMAPAFRQKRKAAKPKTTS